MPPRAKSRIIDDPLLMAPPLLRIVLRRLAAALAKLPVESSEPAFQRRARALVELPSKAATQEIAEAIRSAEFHFCAALLRATRKARR